MNKKRKSKWSDETILKEITKIKDKIGHFPTNQELFNLCRYDLVHAIRNHGGINKFRKLFNIKILKASNGFWSDKTILTDLIKIKKDIGHFPTTYELIKLCRSDLIHAITRNGGVNKFREMMQDKPLFNSKGFWCDDIILKQLSKIKEQISHFPTYNEILNLGRNDLACQITIHGGMNKFRKLLNEKIIRVSTGFWMDDIIIEEITIVKNKFGHFPTQKEIIDLGRYDLSNAIQKHGGLNKFRKIFGYEPIHKEDFFWNNDRVINDLVNIKKDTGHFPSRQELIDMERFDLLHAIARHGGLNKFRQLFGSDMLRVSKGFWTDNTILQDLSKVKEEIGHLPTANELIDIGRQDLIGAIYHNGGFNKFRELLGESVSLYQKYRSELSSYLIKRGKGSENLVKFISQDYCNRNGYPEPKYNQKLSKGHILEIICDIGKTIGIDVTNTNNKSIVSQKWRKKSYHLHLDELWIIVFSDTFTPEDYLKWNTKSPINVKVFSIYGFLEELDYSLDSQTKSKIDKYCSCTFHTKEELKELENSI